MALAYHRSAAGHDPRRWLRCHDSSVSIAVVTRPWPSGGSSDPFGRRDAAALLSSELDRGMIASASRPDGTAEVVRELPEDAELVILRRPIVGG